MKFQNFAVFLLNTEHSYLQNILFSSEMDSEYSYDFFLYYFRVTCNNLNLITDC